MDFILSIGNFFTQATKKCLATCLFLLSHLVISMLSFASSSSEFNFQHIANTQSSEIANQQWFELIADPSNNQLFYIANSNGQIYSLEGGEISPQPLLDLRQLEESSSPEFKLTAISLHPDFALRDQPGFATFYTAHISEIDEKSKTKRLEVNNDDINYQFDAVITEWQFNQVNLARVELSTRRELIRISLPSSGSGINQLSFNPFKKSWNDDYGLLHFSLPATPELIHFPLYSGTVLRINPHRFGRKNYTVPNDNPYLIDTEIDKEIIILGAQQIKQFIWPQKNNEQLLVSHLYNNEHLLSFAQKLNDWRNEIPDKQASHTLNASALILYQGRSLDQLHKQLLYIDKTDDSWQLSSISVIDKRHIAHNVEQQFSTTQWPLTDDIKVFYDHENEILLLNQTKGAVFGVSQESAQGSTTPNSSPNSVQLNTANSSSPFSSWLIFTLLVIICATAFYLFSNRKNNKHLSSLVRRNFAHIEVSQSKQQVGLFRRHQHSTDTVLNISDITASEVLLNDTVISLINLTKEHGFSHDSEVDLRHYFSNEYQDKMVDDKVRKITLLLTVADQNYPISLYARKGNQRLTKKSYKEVIEDLINWCWLVSTTINDEHTEKRKVPKKVTIADKVSDIKKQAPAPSANKPNVVQPEDHSPLEFDENNEDASSTVDKQKAPANGDDTIIDAELVNTLEKLVKLKQQGFLTDEEFSKAKEQLLAKLMK